MYKARRGQKKSIRVQVRYIQARDYRRGTEDRVRGRGWGCSWNRQTSSSAAYRSLGLTHTCKLNRGHEKSWTDSPFISETGPFPQGLLGDSGEEPDLELQRKLLTSVS